MRRLLKSLAVVVALGMLLTLTAAGASASTAAKSQPPAAWAKSVCTSVNGWLKSVEGAAQKSIAAAPTKPKAGKKVLAKVVGSALAATKQLVARFKKAGAPAVKGGGLLATTALEGFKQVQRTLVAELSEVNHLPTKSPAAFVAAARPIEDALESSLEHVQAAFNAATTLDVQPLVKAFNAEPACKAIAAAP